MRHLIAVTVLLFTMMGAAHAVTYPLYSPSRFADAQAQGRHILVEIRATWCATCELQSEALDKLEKKPAFRDLVVFTIDFDRDREMVDRLKVTVPSTLILFEGRTEIARLTGQTDPKEIEAFFEGVSSHGESLPFKSFLLALIAGVLSIISPCVLPLVPIALAAAASKHHFGPAVLSAGFVLVFVAIGLFIDTVGLGIGIDSQVIRQAGAVTMVVFGLVLLSHGLHDRLQAWMAPLQTAGGRALARLAPSGLPGQFLIGALLGTVWSPCIGPTLGAAIALAAQGKSIGHATATMFFFGVGTGLPLVLIGSVSHQTLSRWRKRLNVASHFGHLLLGGLLAAMGAMILSGFDRYLESKLVRFMPDWLTTVVVHF